MISEKKLANAIAGKTARACDGCIRKRARLYCAADDAFLCLACDASVHSANPLARRHERVPLKMASSFKLSEEDEYQENRVPTWHHGFTKKPRTPRHGKHYKYSKPKSSKDQPLLDLYNPVPEICSEEALQEDNEDQLLYRVPISIFDPFAVELCTVPNHNAARMPMFNGPAESPDAVVGNELKNALLHDANYLHGFFPSEMDLAEFAVDFQTLLGKGLEVESFDMERLGILHFDCKYEKLQEGCLGSGRVKVEEDVVSAGAMADQVDPKPFELNLDDYDPSVTCEDDEKVGQMDVISRKDEEFKEDVSKRKKISLRLDYEGVRTAWADQRSPWTTGEKPEVDLNENEWSYLMGRCGTVHQPYVVEMGITGGEQATMVDGGRKARVSRYREKRRTRLFSKKIRYEVRKLNAEKRPRMKGRFVKRANFAAPAFPLLNK